MSEHWYFRENDKIYGPAILATLRQLARSGRIQPSTPVSQSVSGPWLSADQVPGLLAATPIAIEPVVALTANLPVPTRPAASEFHGGSSRVVLKGLQAADFQHPLDKQATTGLDSLTGFRWLVG